MVLLTGKTTKQTNNARITISELLYSIQDGGRGQKDPSTSFFPVTSTNVVINPQSFLTFSHNDFAILVQNFKAILNYKVIRL